LSCVEALEYHESHDVGESTDFVQSHVESFFPLEDEVIEEEKSLF